MYVVLAAAVLILAIAAGIRLASRLLHPPAASAGIQSIAVLPLENLSGDPNQEFFADGMTEELIMDLGQVSALRVISRTSVMRYKKARRTIPDIARELNVDAVIEGSVLRVGNRVRITAQLIRGPTDVHLWARSYERDLGDVLALQDDVARAIAEEVRVKLSGQEQTQLSTGARVDPVAYEQYLLGIHNLNLRTTAGFKKSIENFQAAIARDPGFPAAYAGLANAYNLSGSGADLDPADAFPKAKAAALKAIELQPSLAEGHTELAYELITYEFDWAGAQREFLRALELNPNSAEAHYIYALSWLTPTARHDEAIAEINKTLALDPLSLPRNQGAAYIFYFARKYPEAEEQCKKTISLDPNFAHGHYRLFEVYAQVGRYEQAIAELEKAALLGGAEPRQVNGWISSLRRRLASGGGSGFWDQVAINLQPFKRYVEVAGAYARVDKKNQAFAALDNAVQYRDSDVTYIAVDPAFDSLRSDPRYHALLKRIGLPQ